MLRRLLELVEQGDLTAVTGACPDTTSASRRCRGIESRERGVTVSGCQV